MPDARQAPRTEIEKVLPPGQQSDRSASESSSFCSQLHSENKRIRGISIVLGENDDYNALMSLAEMLDQIPKLSFAERQELIRCAIALDDLDLTG